MTENSFSSPVSLYLSLSWKRARVERTTGGEGFAFFHQSTLGRSSSAKEERVREKERARLIDPEKGRRNRVDIVPSVGSFGGWEEKKSKKIPHSLLVLALGARHSYDNTPFFFVKM